MIEGLEQLWDDSEIDPLDELLRIEKRKAVLKTLFWIGVALAIIILYVRCKNAT